MGGETGLSFDEVEWGNPAVIVQKRQVRHVRQVRQVRQVGQVRKIRQERQVIKVGKFLHVV
jgi:hypothetical protein